MGEEAGVMTSFTKLFTIKTPDDSSISKVLGFTRSGEIITETKKVYEVYPTVEIYKPCSEQINDLLKENMVHSSYALTPRRYFLLITRIVVPFPMILDGESDGYGAKSRAWNDQLEKEKKKEVAFIVTIAKREQQIADLK
nr:hypothetical protein [Tanacetum cinerariifolium]